MLGGAIPSVPEDGEYHWVKLGETDCVSTGWLLYFGPTYESVLMNFRPMREMAGKNLEVFLKMKVDKEYVTLSSLRYVAK